MERKLHGNRSTDLHREEDFNRGEDFSRVEGSEAAVGGCNCRTPHREALRHRCHEIISQSIDRTIGHGLTTTVEGWNRWCINQQTEAVDGVAHRGPAEEDEEGGLNPQEGATSEGRDTMPARGGIGNRSTTRPTKRQIP